MIQLLRQEWEIARDEVTWVPRSFAKCEETIIDKNESISTEGLLWLASSIEILPHSYNSLVLLIQEFMELPPHLLVRRQKSRIAPWKPIFQILCSAYLDKKSIEDYTSDELENAGFLCKALSMLRVEMFGSRFDGFYESLKHSNNEAISTVAHMATLRRGVYLDGLERGLVRLCDSAKYLSLHYFHVQLLIVRQERDSFAYFGPQTLEALTVACTSISELVQSGTHVSNVSIPMLDLILDISTTQFGSMNNGSHSIIDQYSDAVKLNPQNEALDRVHYSFLHLILDCLVQMDESTFPGISQRHALLRRLSAIAQLRPLPPSTPKLNHGILIAIREPPLFSPAEDTLTSLLRGMYTERNEPEDQLMNLIIGLEKLVTSGTNISIQDYAMVLEYLIKKLHPASLLFRRLSTAQSERLTRIEEAGVALIVSVFLSNELYPVLLNPFIKSWDIEKGEQIFAMWSQICQSIPLSMVRIPFVHACILANNRSLRNSVIEFLENYCMHVDISVSSTQND
jgi:hypothetical protein